MPKCWKERGTAVLMCRGRIGRGEFLVDLLLGHACRASVILRGAVHTRSNTFGVAETPRAAWKFGLSAPIQRFVSSRLTRVNCVGIRSRQYVGDAEEFRRLVERSRLPPSRFADLMGASASVVQQYLSGRREVPRVAIGAARWALLVLGHRVELPGDELARLHARRGRRGKCA